MRYWEELTTGLRIYEFRDLARNLDPDGDDAHPDEAFERAEDAHIALQSDVIATLEIAGSLRHAANVQEQMGPPLTTNVQRAMRAAMRRPYGGRLMRKHHPLAFLATHATRYVAEPSRPGLQRRVRSLIAHSSGVPSVSYHSAFARSREHAFRTLDVALEIEDHLECIAALRILGPLMPDVSHLATGLAWDIEHLPSDEK